MTYPEALPHDPPKQIADDLFVVYGSVQLFPLMRITRNMVVVRDEGQLTLINPVRMDEDGLRSLEELGEIRDVLRLGPFHGLDDPFYVDRYKANFWSFEGGTTYTEPAITHTLVEGGELPFSKASLFAFSGLNEPEGAILLQRSPNVLLTCDAVQSYSTPPHMPYTGWFAKLLMPLVGFPNKTIIGPIWLQKLAKDQDGIQAEFKRLLSLDFDQLIAAHGTFVEKGAHAELEGAFEKAFK